MVTDNETGQHTAQLQPAWWQRPDTPQLSRCRHTNTMQTTDGSQTSVWYTTMQFQSVLLYRQHNVYKYINK